MWQIIFYIVLFYLYVPWKLRWRPNTWNKRNVYCQSGLNSRYAYLPHRLPPRARAQSWRILCHTGTWSADHFQFFSRMAFDNTDSWKIFISLSLSNVFTCIRRVQSCLWAIFCHDLRIQEIDSTLKLWWNKGMLKKLRLPSLHQGVIPVQFPK
mgnify:CR=1 FL=1